MIDVGHLYAMRMARTAPHNATRLGNQIAVDLNFCRDSAVALRKNWTKPNRASKLVSISRLS